MRKFICCLIVPALVLGIAGCSHANSGTQTSNDSSSIQTNSSEKSPQSDAQSSDGTESSDEAVQGANGGSASNPNKAVPIQQNILNQIKKALHTNVSVMLPSSIQVAPGLSLTATTASQAANYKVNLYETRQSAGINSKAASNGTLIASIEGIAYPDASSAKASISGYVDENTVSGASREDLGHQIKAFVDAGMGHLIYTWHEGRWCIILDSPNDATYKSSQYPDSVRLAKNIVEYLEGHMLPPPEKIGVIKIRNWNNSDEATIQWQDDKTVYKITCPNPMTALEAATSIKS